jgi:hypothetical protein
MDVDENRNSMHHDTVAGSQLALFQQKTEKGT